MNKILLSFFLLMVSLDSLAADSALSAPPNVIGSFSTGASSPGGVKTRVMGVDLDAYNKEKYDGGRATNKSGLYFDVSWPYLYRKTVKIGDLRVRSPLGCHAIYYHPKYKWLCVTMNTSGLFVSAMVITFGGLKYQDAGHYSWAK